MKTINELHYRKKSRCCDSSKRMWNSEAGTHDDADEWRSMSIIPVIKKYFKVYEKQTGHWKPTISVWHDFGRTNALINLYISH